MNAKYLVISKKNRTTRTFKDASDVAAFMLGRRFDEWLIYQLQEFEGRTDVFVLQEKLKANEQNCKYSEAA